MDSADAAYCAQKPGASSYVIRKIASNGAVHTIAGTNGEGGITVKPKACGGPGIAFSKPNLLYLLGGGAVDKLVLP